jgi:serine/threonine protein kinase
MNGGDLSAILSKSAVDIPWKLRVTIAKDAISAIAWLHENDLIHRDIKTENILVDDSWRAVVADYGFARKFAAGSSKSAMTILGTDEFMAPEVIFGEEYDERADVFSFGVVLAEIITRKPPGKNGFLMRLPKKKFAIDVDELKEAAPPDTPPSLLECAVQCLAYEAEFRSTAEQVVDWLTDLLREIEEAAAAAAEAERQKKKQSGEGGGGSGSGQQQQEVPTSPRPSLILGKNNSSSSSSSSEAVGAGGSGAGAVLFGEK